MIFTPAVFVSGYLFYHLAYHLERVSNWLIFLPLPLFFSDRVEGDRSEGSGQENEDEQ